MLVKLVPVYWYNNNVWGLLSQCVGIIIIFGDFCASVLV